MARILVKTTIPYVADDWHIGRFSLLTQTLQDAGHMVIARDRTTLDQTDGDLAAAGEGAFDQLWLLAVDAGGGLRAQDVAAIERFRAGGGGLLMSRDHQDLGAGLGRIAGVGACQHFQSVNPEHDTARRRVDDTGTPTISWPNYHSGRNGDAQVIEALEPNHPLLAGADGAPIRTLPAHPHEGVVSAPSGLGGFARVVARGRSLATGAGFNLVVAVEAGEASGGGRVVADASFHHFCDCNWDPTLGAPSFVDEPWGDQMARDPAARADARAYVRNIASWLAGDGRSGAGRPPGDGRSSSGPF